MYQQLIKMATACPDADIIEIETMMRMNCGGCLDHLTRRRFNTLAKDCYTALQLIRETEPEFSCV